MPEKKSSNRIRIIHQKKKCIGCGACAVICPKLFKMTEDGKASLFGSEVSRDSKTEKEILSTNEIDCAQQAINVCPVQCIIIEK